MNFYCTDQEANEIADMPADIRNFFGGKPAATVPKYEKALGTEDNVCIPYPFFVGFFDAISSSTPTPNALKKYLEGIFL